jgi:hypothetical protein
MLPKGDGPLRSFAPVSVFHPEKYPSFPPNANVPIRAFAFKSRMNNFVIELKSSKADSL